jgi:hypothetical protein
MVRQVGGKTRQVGHTGVGEELFRLVGQMDVPVNEARSRAQFERLMLRMAAEDEKRQRIGKWARMAWALSTAAVGAGAFRLFAH